MPTALCVGMCVHACVCWRVLGCVHVPTLLRRQSTLRFAHTNLDSPRSLASTLVSGRDGSGDVFEVSASHAEQVPTPAQKRVHGCRQQSARMHPLCATSDVCMSLPHITAYYDYLLRLACCTAFAIALVEQQPGNAGAGKRALVILPESNFRTTSVRGCWGLLQQHNLVHHLYIIPSPPSSLRSASTCAIFSHHHDPSKQKLHLSKARIIESIP